MAAEAPTLIPAIVTELLPGGRCRVRTEDGNVQPAGVAVELGYHGITAGDRVSMLPSAGEFPCTIVRIETPAAPAPARTAPFGARANRTSPEQLKIDRTARPDWPTGADRTPVVGEEVYCTEGMCSVVRVLGRTGNGSRLLELHLEGLDRKPFFAAASNVLVRPHGD